MHGQPNIKKKIGGGVGRIISSWTLKTRGGKGVEWTNVASLDYQSSSSPCGPDAPRPSNTAFGPYNLILGQGSRSY
jgi:hypothetical protein